MDAFDIKKYIDMALRRKWWIIIPFLLTLLAGLGYFLEAPKVYRAQTLILVIPQRVPQRLVTPIVESDIFERLTTIRDQVNSRTNLEAVIKKYNLYGRYNILIDEKVEWLRASIEITIARGGEGEGAFRISFHYNDPVIVRDVANTLTSNFLDENIKMRESRASGTSLFLAGELKAIELQLAEKEEALKRYRERYMGGLPDQLDTNLNMLGRLQNQLTQRQDSLSSAEDRKLLIQTQIAEQTRASITLGIPSASEQQEPMDIPALRNELAYLEAKYTQNHPDIIRLRARIAKLEEERIRGENGVTEGESSPRIEHPVNQQLREVDLQIERIRADIETIKNEILSYQKIVDETPKREQELLSLNRDYDNMSSLYNSLLNRKLEAEIAVSLERKQKGEQFRIIDSAKIPNSPIKPDRQRIFLITLGLGLGLGCGLAFLVETMDTSFKNPEEIETELKLPVLVSMPIRYTEKELRRIKRKNILAFASVTVGFVASAVGIVVAIKGVDVTMSYFKDVLSRF